MLRVNIGCGQSPTPGWRNFDNSPSLWLARHPILVFVLRTFRLIDNTQLHYIAFNIRNSIDWADATKHIQLTDGSVDVLYSSHMLEHLDREEAISFLREAKRVLRKDGIIRLVVPDLQLYVRKYLDDGDADALVAASYLAQSKPKTIFQKLRLLIVGGRHHYWMYDGISLCRLLEQAGFEDASVLRPGQTRIPVPGQLNLFERADESAYVEALRP